LPATNASLAKIAFAAITVLVPLALLGMQASRGRMPRPRVAPMPGGSAALVRVRAIG
jgi:hypothetical protein